MKTCITIVVSIFLAGQFFLTFPTCAQGGATLSTPSPVVGHPLKFEHLSLEDGLSESGVRAILQDSAGFMWFGTWGGLNRFDGYTFKIYKMSLMYPRRRP